jgi:hypothetical protein
LVRFQASRGSDADASAVSLGRAEVDSLSAKGAIEAALIDAQSILDFAQV